ncbi:hypothetical protein X777_13254 [Ooceraea biroi]|uniref:Uncharacterized protein n=1 Tax=Ooceraea biroi TaxID=2015173 RepID=A0A026VY34_OOCBI|nr:hypothetical protein X777_13254 [Ooceraea biroi]
MEGEKDPHNCVQEVVYHVSVCDYRLCTIVREEEIGVYCVLCGNWNKIVSYHRFKSIPYVIEKEESIVSLKFPKEMLTEVNSI